MEFRGYALVLAIFAVGGCLDGGGPQTGSGPGPLAADAPAPGIDFLACTGFAVVVEVPEDQVRAHLPPGYEPLGGITSVQGIPLAVPLGLSPPGLLVNRCDILLPDGTEHQGAYFARSTVALVSAGGHGIEQENASSFDNYVLEMFLDVEAVPALAEHFLAYGWPVHHATFELSEDRFHIVSPDGIDYEAWLGVSLFPYAGTTTGTDDRENRYHHVSTAASYGSLGDVEVRSYTIFGSTLLATGGFFGEVGTGEAGNAFAAIGQLSWIEGPSRLQWAETPSAA